MLSSSISSLHYPWLVSLPFAREIWPVLGRLQRQMRFANSFFLADAHDHDEDPDGDAQVDEDGQDGQDGQDDESVNLEVRRVLEVTLFVEIFVARFFAQNLNLSNIA